MKIVVITGSPRKKGNSFAMAEAFIEEAERCGHTVRRFDAAMMKIGGCHACQTCFNPNRSLETELALFLMTAIRKMWLYIVGS